MIYWLRPSEQVPQIETESSLQNVVLQVEDRTMDNVQTHKNCTKYSRLEIKHFIQP
jgi:hypothetical protein